MGRSKKTDGTSDSPDLISAELEKLGCRIFRNLEELKPDAFIPTGMFGFDRIISDQGGFPGNSVVEIYGPNSTGKTSVALQVAAKAQQMNMKVYYINSERAINPSIVKCFPELDANKVEWIEPDNGESAINIMTTILKLNPKSLIVNDSIPACLPAAIDDGNAGDATVGALARLFSPFMPKAKRWCRENNCLLIQLNQERSKIGPMVRGGTEQPGGRAVKFYSDIRIKLTKRFKNGDIKVGEDIVGHIIEAKAVKTRWTSPFQTADLPLVYGSGFDIGRELLGCAELYGVVQKSGAWYSYFKEGADLKTDEPVYKAQGIDRMAAWIRQNEEVQIELADRMTALLT